MHRAEIRSLPFYFSNLFFISFTTASGLYFILYSIYPLRWYFILILDALIIVAAIVDFLIAPSIRAISIERKVLYPLSEGAPNEIRMEAVNRSGQDISIVIEDDIPDKCSAKGLPILALLRRAEPKPLQYRLSPKDRGDGEFGNIHFWITGPLRLVWKHGASQGKQKVKFYPGLKLVKQGKIQARRLSARDMVRSINQKGEGAEFDSLRDYMIGDDVRQIHWTTTAKKGKPMVRQNRMERSQTIFLVLDAGRMMTARVLSKTKFDYALSSALLLTRSGLELGDNVGLTAIARELLCFVPPLKGPRHYGHILDSSYNLEPRLEEARFHVAFSNLSWRLRTRSLVIIFTDLIDERASTSLVRFNLGLSPRHLPLVVAMSDNEVIEVADEIPKQERDLYRQGIASEILNRREQLIAKLRSSGVLVIDTEPDRISAALLDKYLEIKSRRLL